jgi:hypothetical protein
MPLVGLASRPPHPLDDGRTQSLGCPVHSTVDDLFFGMAGVVPISLRRHAFGDIHPSPAVLDLN